MMPSNRFTFPDDDRLLSACDSLKLHFYKDEEGEVTAYFELSGSVGPAKDEEDGAFAPRADLTMVSELLDRFQQQRKD